ncbi:YcaO-like family protein [Streptomyces sp. NBC_01261]|uniref:YcaO-like family protein n=1 Tax=Streptomyces sp. NBC_01261 TaxID=2903802 RepID=UPI002E2FADD9|nr:YcaO-like family protein [Streptomyces sp. NBC_01261]
MGNAEADAERIVKNSQAGERERSLEDAFRQGMTAAHDLGFEVRLRAVVDADPGVWRCELWQAGKAREDGLGFGKGSRDAAQVGAVFEALEHYVSGIQYLDRASVRNVRTEEVADPKSLLYRDQAVRLVGELDSASIGCLEYENLSSKATAEVPIFLSVPDYVSPHSTSFRADLGDTCDYSALRRYSCNNGWAAGVTVVEATVHALNEVVERDALSLLLIGQFLRARPRPLRVVERTTLPAELATLAQRADDATGRTVHLIDMTTDVPVPAFIAYLPPENGEPARIRGCGASLSSEYAAYRALTEIVQVQGVVSDSGNPGKIFRNLDTTRSYPPLHACRRMDLTARLADAETISFRSTNPPEHPQAHLEEQMRLLSEGGYSVLRHQAATPEGLAVVNVFVPGMERFMLVTDGLLVLPGPRGDQVMTA